MDRNREPELPIDILMGYGATRYVAEEYLHLCLWDDEISDTDNLSRFQAYLDEMNVTL